MRAVICDVCGEQETIDPRKLERAIYPIVEDYQQRAIIIKDVCGKCYTRWVDWASKWRLEIYADYRKEFMGLLSKWDDEWEHADIEGKREIELRFAPYKE